MNPIEEYWKDNNINVNDLFKIEYYPLDDLYECSKRRFYELEFFNKLASESKLDIDMGMSVFDRYVGLCTVLMKKIVIEIGYEPITGHFVRQLEPVVQMIDKGDYCNDEIFCIIEDVMASLAVTYDFKNELLGNKNAKKIGRNEIEFSSYIVPKYIENAEDENAIISCIQRLFDKRRENGPKKYYSTIMMAAVDSGVLSAAPTTENFYKNMFKVDVAKTTMGKVNSRTEQDELRYTGKQSKKQKSQVYLDALEEFKLLKDTLDKEKIQ